MKRNGNPKTLDALLETKSHAEQAERVQQLIHIASAPVIDLVIRYDDRNQQVSVTAIGGKINYGQARMILDWGREFLVQAEKQELAGASQADKPAPAS